MLGMEDKRGEFLPCSQKASQGEPLLIRPYGHDSQSGKNVKISMFQRKTCYASLSTLMFSVSFGNITVTCLERSGTIERVVWYLHS